MDVTLTTAQVTILRELLDTALRDMTYEIADTDNSEFKRKLKARRDDVKGLLDLVGGPLPS